MAARLGGSAMLRAMALTGALALSSAARTNAARPDEHPSDAVGAIEGIDIAVSGPMTVEVVNGKVRTILRSGSDVRVKSGQARIDLVEGGNISICGPAHLSVLKSGGSLTIALDSGTVRAHILREPALTVYTAQIQAKPLAIGGGAQDALVGFETPGAMCVRATTGAVRVEQQLTAQSVVVPQGGDVMLYNGQLDLLRSGAGHCPCFSQPAPLAQSPEMSLLATTEEAKKAAARAIKTGVTRPSPQAEQHEEPVYQVFMPPLAYDAKAAVQPEPDPRTIVLVRRVRVRPTLIFEGRVEGDPVIAQVVPPPRLEPVRPVNLQQEPRATSGPRKEEDSVFQRVRDFFRRLWSGNS